jgi:hypothetical protein
MKHVRIILRKVFNFSEGPWWFWVLWTIPFAAITTFWTAHIAAILSTLDLPMWMEGPIGFLSAMSIFASLTTLLYIFACPILSIFCLFNPRWRKYVPATMLLFALSLTTFFVSDYVYTAREFGFRRVANNSKPLIAAIERYRADSNAYPDFLHAPVPIYIAEIPNTGIVGDTMYTYRKATPSDKFTGYELFVSCGFGLQFDRLTYWPNHDSPYISTGLGGGSKAIDEWYFLRD